MNVKVLMFDILVIIFIAINSYNNVIKYKNTVRVSTHDHSKCFPKTKFKGCRKTADGTKICFK